MEPMEMEPEVAQDPSEPEVQVDDEQAKAEAERKKLAEIREQAKRACERHARFLEAKDATSAAKAQWESAVETLQDLCLEGDESLPLLDSAEPEDWRRVRLDSMEPAAKPSVLAKLKDAGIETVGQLADYTREHDLLDIPGIGGASKEEIEAVLDPFWKQHGEEAGEHKPAEAAE